MIHLSKPLECISQSLNSNKLWTSVNNDVSILVHQYANIDAQGLGYMWMVERLHFWGEGDRHMGTPCTSPSVLL